MPDVDWLRIITWLSLTFFAYLVGVQLFQRSGNKMLLHPLITTVTIMLLMLYISATPIKDYQGATSILHWLLGPATISLAIPLYRQLMHIRRLGLIILVPILVGGTIAPLLAFLGFMVAGAPEPLTLSILPKSITTPLAMDVADIIGGYPALAAVFVILTGIIGAVFANWVFSLQPKLDDESKGLALGTIAHAVGTGHALTISDKAGAFSSLALCINGIVTAIALPLLYFLLN